MSRKDTKVVHIGDRVIGGGNPVLIQSMCNTKTEDVQSTINQILSLEKAGCDIIRVAVPTMKAADALKDIKKEIHIPLVADIHFDYRLAIAAMENGADKIRFAFLLQAIPLRKLSLPARSLKHLDLERVEWKWFHVRPAAVPALT